MSVGDATGATAANIFILMRRFIDTVRGIARRNGTNWKNAPNTNAATNGKAAEFRRNITAVTITAEGTATIIMTTITTIMAETTAEGELGVTAL